MKKLILLGLVVVILAGCSKSVAYTVVNNRSVDERNVQQRSYFMNMVMYMRSTKDGNEQTKSEVMKHIELSGFIYKCESKFDCFITRNNLKVRIYPDHVYIEYPNKSYKKIWDINLAVDTIYS